MKEEMKELQKNQRIGEVLSRRLVESSYDTIGKVAGAEKKGLERIAGMNPQKVRDYRNPSQKMTGEAEKVVTHGRGNMRMKVVSDEKISGKAGNAAEKNLATNLPAT